VIAAVVLAAGAATRFGSPKQRLFVGEVVERVRRSSVGDVVVVTGAYDVDVDARVVHCPDWERGPGASLRCGLAALGDDVEAAVVVLADGPDLNAAAIDRLVTQCHKSGSTYLAASYGGVRGHPVLITRALWGEIPEEGLRAVEPELVPCDDLGPPGDVDFADEVPERFGRPAAEDS
jgi:CTP:molybdopterin cytidylyltransferase MocA